VREGVRFLGWKRSGGLWRAVRLRGTAGNLFDPKHPEYQERRDWLAEGFDPELFNVEIVNRRLRRLKLRREGP
jgi:hypothetical protein